MQQPGLRALLPLLALAGCASLSPSLRGIYRAEPSAEGDTGVPLVALVGDIGDPQRWAGPLARGMAHRLAASAEAPVVVLGDVFYGFGLLGVCPGDDGTSSLGACEGRGTPQTQLEAVLGPYREALGERRLIALAGNHDHHGDPESTANPCALVPQLSPGWEYLAHGCALDEETPLRTLETGGVALVLLDSERMIQDASFRAAASAALRAELARLRSQSPEAWLVVAAHHPLETHGAHNGAGLGPALLKDLYWLRNTALLPLQLGVNLAFPWLGAQDVYDWRYRAYRRSLYRVFRDQPIDLFAAGHDHSLQWIEIEHPGVRWQLISGSGAKTSAVKRFGLDLLWSNRLARALGLRDTLPAPEHHLRFASGSATRAPLSAHGYAILLGGPGSLRVEFYDAAEPDAPLFAATLER